MGWAGGRRVREGWVNLEFIWGCVIRRQKSKVLYRGPTAKVEPHQGPESEVSVLV